MPWYVRSLADGHTHRGLARGRKVTASCGLAFVAPRLVVGRVSLPGEPQDPDQVCPTCRTRP